MLSNRLPFDTVPATLRQDFHYSDAAQVTHHTRQGKDSHSAQANQYRSKRLKVFRFNFLTKLGPFVIGWVGVGGGGGDAGELVGCSTGIYESLIVGWGVRPRLGGSGTIGAAAVIVAVGVVVVVGRTDEPLLLVEYQHDCQGRHERHADARKDRHNYCLPAHLIAVLKDQNKVDCIDCLAPLAGRAGNVVGRSNDLKSEIRFGLLEPAEQLQFVVFGYVEGLGKLAWIGSTGLVITCASRKGPAPAPPAPPSSDSPFRQNLSKLLVGAVLML